MNMRSNWTPDKATIHEVAACYNFWMKKRHLPAKTCAACGKQFAWRKKWAKCWEQVKYCSERCRKMKE